jgi:hypothetical protein
MKQVVLLVGGRGLVVELWVARPSLLKGGALDFMVMID